MHELNPAHIAITLVTVAVVIVAIGFVAIPILSDIGEDHSVDIGYHLDINGEEGAVWTYTVTASLDDWEMSLGGSAAQFASVEDRTITVRFDDPGRYVLIITATSHQPEQTATQAIEFQVGESTNGGIDASPLVLVIPTVLLVGLIAYIVRRSNYV